MPDSAAPLVEGSFLSSDFGPEDALPVYRNIITRVAISQVFLVRKGSRLQIIGYKLVSAS